ncbi:MAG: N-acetylmuramoyl-L-alanine amidase [Syntrophomonas sp.]
MYKHFKKLFMALLLTSLLIAVFISPAIADSGVITGSTVNVRSGPGANFSVVSSLNKDTRVEILEKNSDWVKIKSGSITGWVYESLINIDKVDIRLQVIEDTVNLRSGPGTTYSQIGQAVKGDVLILEDVQGEWYKVKTSSATIAFVRSDLVKKTGLEEVTMVVMPQVPTSSSSTSSTSSSSSSVKSQNPVVLLDNNKLSFEVPPVVENNRVLVPLRAIFEAMGAKVEWQQANNRAVAIKGNTTVVLPLNSIHPTINGEKQTLDVPAKVVNQRILAPLRFVGEAFGGQVAWDQADFTVKMQSPSVVDTPPVQVELPGLRLSRSWESTGVKIIMESDKTLKSEKTTSGNTISYQFSNFKIEGTTSIKQVAGITAAATTQGNNVVVNINIPAGLEYTTSTENNGQREVVSIPNAITNVTRSTFGSGGEKISLSAIASFTYTTNEDNNRMVIELNNVLPGKANASYNFSNSLISNMSFTKKTGQSNTTVLTIDTTIPAKFAVGTSSDGTALYILFIDKSILQSRVPMVVLDPGHGGKDPGSSGYAIEKDANLAIALKAGEVLSQNGIQVMYTHKDDTYLELNEITDIANMYNAAVFVSIHNNSSVSASATGTETYYYAPLEKPNLFIQKDERYSLASKLQKYVVNAIGLPDRGVKTANFAVLRNSQMPSALVEGAFVSNPLEGTLLTQDNFRNQIGEAIAQAIMEYMRENVTS